jgi:hypothetical protein
MAWIESNRPRARTAHGALQEYTRRRSVHNASRSISRPPRTRAPWQLGQRLSGRGNDRQIPGGVCATMAHRGNRHLGDRFAAVKADIAQPARDVGF